MTTLKSALREVSGEYSRGLATIPSPEKVRAAAAEIRRGWTPRERRRRAQLARCLLVERLLGVAIAAQGKVQPLRIRRVDRCDVKPTSQPWR